MSAPSAPLEALLAAMFGQRYVKRLRRADTLVALAQVRRLVWEIALTALAFLVLAFVVLVVVAVVVVPW